MVKKNQTQHRGGQDRIGGGAATIGRHANNKVKVIAYLPCPIFHSSTHICPDILHDGGRKGRNFIYTFVATLMVLSGTDGGVEEEGLLSRVDTHELQ